jgi:hypothetical protein
MMSRRQQANMAPQLKENREFTEFLEEWVAKIIQSRVSVAHAHAGRKTGREEDERSERLPGHGDPEHRRNTVPSGWRVPTPKTREAALSNKSLT